MAMQIAQDAASLPVLLAQPALALNVVSHLPEAVLLIDSQHPEFPVVYSNSPFFELTGYSLDEVIGASCTDCFRELAGEATALKLQKHFDAGLNLRLEFLAYRKNGESFWGELSLTAIYDTRGQTSHMLLLIRDVTLGYCARQNLQESTSLYMALVASLSEGVIVQDPSGNILACNHAAQRLFGVEEGMPHSSRLEECGLHFLREDGSPCPPDDTPSMKTFRTGEAQVDVTLGICRSDGAIAWVSIHTEPLRHQGLHLPHAVVSSFVEITPLQAPDEAIRHLAYHDALTGLPNRRLLEDRVRQCIEHSSRHQKGFSLLFLDLDGFKQINDRHGHRYGDVLLCRTAERLLDTVRAEDSVCRVGGDEFVLLLPETDSVSDLLTVVEKLRTALSTPVIFEGECLRTSPSIGISRYPEDGTTLAELIAAADIAMYTVKQSGRNNYLFFNSRMHERKHERRALERDLKSAIEKEELQLLYYPQMTANGEVLTGIETQISWNHPQHGYLNQSRLLPLARAIGLEGKLRQWLLENACKQQRAWQKQGLITAPLTINLSLQRVEVSLVRQVEDELKKSKISAQSLCLVFSEATVMHESRELQDVLNDLGDLGVGLSIENFGAGYASLAYLRRPLFHSLQIGDHYVSSIGHDAGNRALVGAIINFAHSLGMVVIAKGVEKSDELSALREMRCDSVQGEFISASLAEPRLRDILQHTIPSISKPVNNPSSQY